MVTTHVWLFYLARALLERYIYEAHIEVDMPSGSVARHPSKVIVKLAFSREHTDRLRHEYSIYRRLSHRPVRVENIPAAFGIFEDVESQRRSVGLSFRPAWLWNTSLPRGKVVPTSRLAGVAVAYACDSGP